MKKNKMKTLLNTSILIGLSLGSLNAMELTETAKVYESTNLHSMPQELIEEILIHHPEGSFDLITCSKKISNLIDMYHKQIYIKLTEQVKSTPIGETIIQLQETRHIPQNTNPIEIDQKKCFKYLNYIYLSLKKRALPLKVGPKKSTNLSDFLMLNQSIQDQNLLRMWPNLREAIIGSSGTHPVIIDENGNAILDASGKTQKVTTPESIRSWINNTHNQKTLEQVSTLFLLSLELSHLPSEIMAFKGLQELWLSNKQITSIVIPQGLINLKKLVLYCNLRASVFTDQRLNSRQANSNDNMPYILNLLSKNIAPFDKQLDIAEILFLSKKIWLTNHEITNVETFDPRAILLICKIQDQVGCCATT